MYVLSAVLILYVFWLLLSGIYTPFLLVVGAACAAGVVLLAHRMEVVDHEGHPVHLSWRVLWYWPWLFKEIAKSAWDVSRIILTPRLPISPTLVKVRTSQKTSVGTVTYANSITLTPGTLSVAVHEDSIEIHALDEGLVRELQGGAMAARARRVEGG